MSAPTKPNSDLNGATIPNNTYPQLSYITNITQAFQGVITFAAPHEFTIGEVIGLRVAPQFGMFQLNNQDVLVVAKTSNTVTINVNTLGFNPFINAGTSVQRPCIAVPSSSGIVINSFPIQTNLTDAFDNIPPS